MRNNGESVCKYIAYYMALSNHLIYTVNHDDANAVATMVFLRGDNCTHYAFREKIKVSKHCIISDSRGRRERGGCLAPR